MMDRNDPRLTAYALGEMDAQERAEFEKALENDPAARAEVDAIRAIGGKLAAELANAPAPTLTEAQRASVAKAAMKRRVPLAILLMPVAACLIAAVALIWDRSARPVGAPDALEARRMSGARAEQERRQGPFDDSFIGSPANPANSPPGTIPEPGATGFRGPNGSVVPGARVPADSLGRRAAPPSPQPESPATEIEEAVGAPTTPAGPDAGGGAPASPAPAADPGDPTSPQLPTLGLGARGTKKAPAAGRAGGDAGGLVVKESFEEAKPPEAKFKEDLRRRALPSEKRSEERPAEREEADREGYDRIRENPFVRVAEEDSSTFSIDVDTASYANVRRFLLNENRLPPPDAVRIEEMINYFSYAYAPPEAGSPDPFRIHVEVAQCPWDTSHRLARVAIKGKVIDQKERPPSNLVFLVDVSGSMDQPDKLPLVQASLRLLAENLGERDRVAIVVYAGAAGLVLPSTGDKRAVIDAIERLRAGGSTAGAAGIQLAYETATANFLKGGVNRVILCTDGDFNVGISDNGALTRFIEEKAKTGVFLSVLGFGTGNYQDAKMQQLADKGNGNHAYIDSILEARKVLGEEMSGTLVTIAKDVKIQLFFNPRRVAGFRLIGYENRLLSKQDFNDDTKDAGEIGAGHSVTALYELVLAGSEVPAAPPVDENPFVAKAQATIDSNALFQLKLRYKQPDGDTSKLLQQMVEDDGKSFDAASPDFRWAGAVAAFGMSLRDAKTLGPDAILEIAKGAAGDDKYRQEFLRLVETAKLLRR
ncbi:MAG TPA: von Willebrand factor type A domain-containing protein [Planctomycetota bacterium]|nr:von Willebrand factor type A domain-containing protein [Planctomycetota bacterium]